MANPAPTINQINAFNATQGTTIDFNIIGGTELVRSNKIYIYDLSDNSLICTHLYVSTESIHELPANTDGSIVYESGKSSADFVNGAQYYAQIQTFTDIAGTQGGSGLSVSKLFWCLVDPSLTIATIPSSISTTSYNVSATYDANTSVVSNIIQQYQFSLYSATGSLLQSSGVVVGNGEQQGTSTAYDISYNFSGLSVGSSYYVVVDVTTTQGMSISAQSSTFTVSIDTPTLGEATVVNNACDGYISVTSNLSSEYGGSASGEIATFETDSVNNVTKLEVALEPTQEGSGDPSPTNVRPITGHDSVEVMVAGKNFAPLPTKRGYWATADGAFVSTTSWVATEKFPVKPNTQYHISGSFLTRWCAMVCYDANGNYIGGVGEQSGSGDHSPNYSFTTPNNCYYIAVDIGNKNDAQEIFPASYTDLQVELGTTATDYVPYVEPVEVEQDFNVTLTPTIIDETPYLFKQTGDVRGDRESLELIGGTVNWNQLAKYNARTGTVSGISYTVANDGTVTLSAGTTTGVIGFNADVSFTGKNGHVIYISGCPNGGEDGYYYVRDGYEAGSRNLDIGNGVIVKKTNDNLIAQIYVGSGKTIPTLKFRPQITDLTAFFGNSTTADYVYSLEQANAGAGIAWLRKYFPDLFAYSPYNTGTLESVKPTAHVTRGVNQFDKSTATAGKRFGSFGKSLIDRATGSVSDYIKVLPNTVYYAKDVSGSGQGNTIVFYDGNKTLLGYVDVGVSTKESGTFTTPSNCGYIRFQYETVNENTVCINISNADINGQYFPYESHTYPITELELRGILKLVDGELRFDGDTRKADGTVTRKWTVKNLATLSTSDMSNLSVGDNTVRVYIGLTSMKPTTSTTEINILADKLNCYAPDYIVSNDVEGISENRNANVNGFWIRIAKSKLSSNDYAGMASYFASNPINVLYELKTPTTETADPFTDPQEVSIYGTEEFVSSNGVPVGNKTTYKTRDIFGGTIDLASGVLTVDRVGSNLGDFTWTYVSARSYMRTSDLMGIAKSGSLSIVPDAYCDALVVKSWNQLVNSDQGVTIDNEAYVQVKYPNMGTDATAFKEMINGVMLYYPLATPLTYQLTPHEIETLVGTNNVWSNAGDVLIEFNIPITNLLVKRQDVDDVSGDWLTLYSQHVEQASDMDFTFIDFLNQYGKTYKYALVPLLTQAQSGVEVEVEGGYTVSDEVQSIFDGVYIGDSTGVQRLKAGVAYNNLNTNQQVGVIPTLGNKYPVIVSNGNIQYDTGSVSGLIVPDDFYSDGNLSRLDMSDKRGVINDFITNKKPKILKDWNGNIWLVVFTDNVDVSFDNNYGMGVATFTSGWTEVGDPTNQEDLQRTGLINVGGD